MNKSLIKFLESYKNAMDYVLADIHYNEGEFQFDVKDIEKVEKLLKEIKHSCSKVQKEIFWKK